MNFDQMVIRYDISGELEEYAVFVKMICRHFRASGNP